MLALTGPEELADPAFKWEKKRRLGGKNKDVQFYESFSYDGVEYALYDCVYMHKQGEPAPYIGKLVKIWETAEGLKRVKVHWFFRPSEISYYLKDAKVLGNELFFASGEGKGLANLNPLEAIAGKCNVVCTSSDGRNPQPSAKELQMADYVFYRIFDVKSCTISDQIDDKVGGLEVEFVFNRRESVGALDGPKLNAGGKCEGNVVALKEKPEIAVAGTALVEKSTTGAKNVGSNICEKKDKFKDTKLPVSQVLVEKGVNHERKSLELDDAPSKTELNGVQGIKDRAGCREDVIQSENSSPLDEKLSHYGFSLSKEASISGNAEDVVGLQKDSKSNENPNVLQENLSKANAASSSENEKLGSTHRKDSFSAHKDKKDGGNLRPCGENTSQINVISGDVIRSPLATSVSPKGTLRSPPNKDSAESKQVAKPAQSLSTTKKRPLEMTIKENKGKSNLEHDKSHENKEKKLGSDPNDEGYIKKAKLDNSVKQSEENKNNIIKKAKVKTKVSPKSGGEGPSKVHNEKEKNHVGKMKNSPKSLTCDDKAKSKLQEDSKENDNEKDGKLSNDNLPNRIKTKEDGGKVGGKIIEVTRRPPEKATWIKLSWEQQMKNADDQRRLVLLLNLDPQYTSGEVEDIVWHAFRENCTARVLPHTAISNPYSGQALVVFKSRDAANKVVSKLDEGCLMLPNQRPLVACPAVLPKFSEKQTTYVGHMEIDKVRRLRGMKEAVCTSHYSQHNTLEFEMALDWCLLQSQSNKWWKSLYEEQRKELKKHTDSLKSK